MGIWTEHFTPQLDVIKYSAFPAAVNYFIIIYPGYLKYVKDAGHFFNQIWLALGLSRWIQVAGMFYFCKSNPNYHLLSWDVNPLVSVRQDGL